MASSGEQGIAQHGVHGGWGWSLSLADAIMAKRTNGQANQLVRAGWIGGKSELC